MGEFFAPPYKKRETAMNATIKEVLTRVQREDGKYNLINANGKLFFDKWFECIGYFDDGLARVQIERNGKFNLIGENGKFLSEQWFDWIGDFLDGLALVQRERENPRFNYIDKEGKIISDEWFRWVDYFHDGIARVQREDYSYNLIDKQGKILSEEWFEWIDDFDKYDRAIVYRKNGEKCKIDKTGKIVICK